MGRTNCLVLCTSRLKGAARFWYDSEPETMTSWDMFSRKLQASFPSVIDQSDVHLKLTRRIKAQQESYESYAYEMAAIAWQGNIAVRSIPKYIIAGLNDKELARALSNLGSIQELLSRIKETFITIRKDWS